MQTAVTTATITCTVTVDDPDTGDAVLRNAVTSDTPGASCATESAPDLPCEVEVPVTVPSPSPTPTPTWTHAPRPTSTPTHSPRPIPTHSWSHSGGPSRSPGGHPADHGRPGRPGDLADTGSASVGIGIAAGLLVLAGLAMVRFRTTRGRRH
nr:hypothetical protein OG461_13495 [Streptomyces sp. NBC_00995]